MSLLDVSGLTIRYGDDIVVDGVAFSVDRNETVGLVGESGSGKSQSALAIPGLLPVSARFDGSIRFDGTEILGLDETGMNRLRGTRIAMIFQDPMQALNPFVTIGVQLSRILKQQRGLDGARAREQVIAMLDRVGLPDAGRQYRTYPHELSGGMRQRVLIASTLLCEPELLIADEPTTALDVTVQAQILDLLEEIRGDMAMLLITHDLGIVAGRCERMVVLEKGRVVESGMTREVFEDPQHPHTRALLEAAPRLDRGTPRGAIAGDPVLAIDDARVVYGGRGKAMPAVRGVGLTVCAGETVAIVGESGSGKSSLVRAALGLVPMQAGTVVFQGVELPAGLGDRSKSTLRGLQLVFQDPVASLDPQMRVVDIVAEPLAVHEASLSPRHRRERAARMLERTGLGPEFLRKYPHELSGGQAQRVAIARSLVLEPAVLVCDEAVAALDGTIREQILALLSDIQSESGLSIVFITHDLAVVRSIAHRVLVMYFGGLVELASSTDLFGSPQHPYTKSLLDAVPVPDPARPGGQAVVAGEVPSPYEPPPGCSFHPRCPMAEERCRREVPIDRVVGGTTVSCHFAGEAASAHR